MLAPVAILVVWLFGHVAPAVERAAFVVLPLGALLFAAGNMLVPQHLLAAVGVPAWLRAPRPQDERGAGSYTTQCHVRGKDGSLWHAEGSDLCTPADPDRTRFRSNRRAQDISYRFVAAGASCAAS